MFSCEFSLAADLLGRWLADDRAAQLLERLGDEVLHPRGQDGEEAAEVLGVPGAGEVGLAEADQLVAAQAQEELLGPGHDHDRAAAAPWPVERLVADMDGDVEAVDGGAEEGPGDARGEAGAKAGGQLVEPGPVPGAEVDREPGRRGLGHRLDSFLRVGGAGLDREAAQPQPDAVHSDQQRPRGLPPERPAAGSSPYGRPESDAWNVAPSSVVRLTTMSSRSSWGTGTARS